MSSAADKEIKGNREPEKPKVEKVQPKIMTKPLPMILDELEDYIKRVEEAVKQAQAAAKDSREAAAQAKMSGEKAAEAAKKAAEIAVAKVREEVLRAIDALNTKLTDKISDLEAELGTLEEKVTEEAFTLDRAFLEAKNRHLEESPFLKK